MPPDEGIVVREAGRQLLTENPGCRDRSETKRRMSALHLHFKDILLRNTLVKDSSDLAKLQTAEYRYMQLMNIK